MQNIINKDHENLPELYSQNFQEVINLLLSKSPEKRLSIKKLINLNEFVKGKYSIFLEMKTKSERSNNKDLVNKQIDNLVKDEFINMNFSNFCQNCQTKNYFNSSPFKRLNYMENPLINKNNLKFDPNFKLEKIAINQSTNNYFKNKTKINDATKFSTNCISNSGGEDSKKNLPLNNIQKSNIQHCTIIRKEFYNSEKQEKQNNYLMSKIPPVPLFPFVPFTNFKIKIIKQKIIPNNKSRNLKNDIVFWSEENRHYKNKPENTSIKNDNNLLSDKSNYEIINKPMFSFLSEKIGE